MGDTLRINSYNCRSIKSSLHSIRTICDTSDVVFLQETWLAKFDLSFLHTVHVDFIGYGVSAFNSNDSLLSGRPYGGIAILFRKALQDRVQVRTVSERIMIADISTAIGQICLLNVYLPTDYRDDDSLDEFSMAVGQIECEIAAAANYTCHYGIIGDFNADAKGSRFYTELSDFCEDNNLVISDVQQLRGSQNVFTFQSQAHLTTSWLDHCLFSQYLHTKITEIRVDYGVIESDHFPLSVELDVPFDVASATDGQRTNNARPAVTRSKCKWHKVNRMHVDNYNQTIALKLDLITYIVDELSNHCHSGCTVVNHSILIDQLYSWLTDTILESAGMHIPQTGPARKSELNVFGWNDYVRAAHQLARSAFLAWRDAGSPVQGSVAEHMRITRSKFKHAFRSCKRLSKRLKGTALATFLRDKDCRQFWKQVQHDLKPATPLPVLFDNEVGDTNISNHWKNHFSAIYQDNSCSSNEENLDRLLVSSTESNHHINAISSKEIAETLRCMKGGKAPGVDNITVEHLVHLDQNNLEHIRLLLNAAMFHAHLPSPMIKSLLVPLVKDKACDIGSLTNYRAIALSTSISKLYELIILERVKPTLITDDSQFGFKCGHSTTHAALLLKEIAKHYTDKGSPVYACFLDASKAFDRVCHEKLFALLINRGIPTQYVKILINWYSTQQMCVRWGNSVSEAFHVKNGVKQGGSLSPLLFAIYINDFLVNTRKKGNGCHIAGMPANVLAYADDLVLISPTRSGLQRMITDAEEFAQRMDVQFNINKSVAMCITGRNTKLSKWLGSAESPVPVLLNGAPLAWVKEFKYLGHIISHDLSDTRDAMRVKRSLYFQTNMLISKYNFMDRRVLIHLFKTHCSQLYGVELWDLTKSKSSVKSVCIAYHACIKRLLSIPRYCRNHTVCATYGLLTCEALLAKNSFFLARSISDSQNKLLKIIWSSSISQTGIIAVNNVVSRHQFSMINCNLDACSKADVVRALKRHIADIAQQQMVSTDM